MQTLQDRAKKAAEIIATPHQYTSFDVQVKGLLGGEYNIAYGRPND